MKSFEYSQAAFSVDSDAEVLAQSDFSFLNPVELTKGQNYQAMSLEDFTLANGALYVVIANSWSAYARDLCGQAGFDLIMHALRAVPFSDVIAYASEVADMLRHGQREFDDVGLMGLLDVAPVASVIKMMSFPKRFTPNCYATNLAKNSLAKFISMQQDLLKTMGCYTPAVYNQVPYVDESGTKIKVKPVVKADYFNIPTCFDAEGRLILSHMKTRFAYMYGEDPTYEIEESFPYLLSPGVSLNRRGLNFKLVVDKVTEMFSDPEGNLFNFPNQIELRDVKEPVIFFTPAEQASTDPSKGSDNPDMTTGKMSKSGVEPSRLSVVSCDDYTVRMAVNAKLWVYRGRYTSPIAQAPVVCETVVRETSQKEVSYLYMGDIKPVSGKIYHYGVESSDMVSLTGWVAAPIDLSYCWNIFHLKANKKELNFHCHVVEYQDVPKSFRARRGIMIDSAPRMARQLKLKEAMAYYRGRRLLPQLWMPCERAEQNRELAEFAAATDCWATIDQSSASDAMFTEFIRRCVPGGWFKALNEARPTHMVSESPLMKTTQAIELITFSGMGCGFTFELLSAVSLNLIMEAYNRCEEEKADELDKLEDLITVESCPVFHRIRRLTWKAKISCRDKFKLCTPGGRPYYVSVVGDDIIAPSCVVPYFEDIAKKFGFKVNLDKTFSKGSFRESCGGDWLKTDQGVVDATPIYWPRAQFTELMVKDGKLHMTDQWIREWKDNCYHETTLLCKFIEMQHRAYQAQCFGLSRYLQSVVLQIFPGMTTTPYPESCSDLWGPVERCVELFYAPGVDSPRCAKNYFVLDENRDLAMELVKKDGHDPERDMWMYVRHGHYTPTQAFDSEAYSKALDAAKKQPMNASAPFFIMEEYRLRKWLYSGACSEPETYPVPVMVEDNDGTTVWALESGTFKFSEASSPQNAFTLPSVEWKLSPND